MSFAILRTAKLKTAAAIRGVSRHNDRTREVLNANKTKNNLDIINGGPDLYHTVMKKIEEAGARYRSNSVLAQEVFLSVSPEFFRPENPEAYGTYDFKKVKEWATRSGVWLKESFGLKNIVDIKVHLDEATPHMHAVVVPLTKDNRLCAKEIFSKFTLKQYQTSYAEKLRDLGIKRGIEGSKAKHEKVKKYYTAVNSQAQKIPKLKQPGIMLTKKARKKYQENINKSLNKKIEPILQKAKSAEHEHAKRQEYQATAQVLTFENQQLKKENKKLKEENSAVKEMIAQVQKENEKLREIPEVKELEKLREEVTELREEVAEYENAELEQFNAKYETDEMEL